MNKVVYVDNIRYFYEYSEQLLNNWCFFVGIQLFFPERASGGPLADEYNRERHCARLN